MISCEVISSIRCANLKIHMIDMAKNVGIKHPDYLSGNIFGVSLKKQIIDRLNPFKFSFVKISLDFEYIRLCDASFLNSFLFSLSAYIKKNMDNTVIVLENITEELKNTFLGTLLLKEQIEKERLLYLYNDGQAFSIIGNASESMNDILNLYKSNSTLNPEIVSAELSLEMGTASKKLKAFYDNGLCFRTLIPKGSFRSYVYRMPSL